MTSADVRRALILGVFLAAALPAAAQVTTTEPIRVAAPKPKKIKWKAEVVVMTSVAITARDLENTNLVRTFRFDAKLAPKMSKMIGENRSYQSGDRVVIEFVEGTETAVKIKGKPRQRR